MEQSELFSGGFAPQEGGFMDINKAVRAYVALRDRIKGLKSEFEAEEAKLKEGMKKLEELFLAHCKETGASGISTDNGNVSRQVQTTYWASDWDSIDKFSRELGVELRQKRLSKEAITSLIEAGHALPQAIKVSNEYVIRVTKR